jgi:transcription antitermination factor NusG
LNWYAVYTKPRWEKKVAVRIAEKGLEVYCPLNKVRKKWSDRYKVVEEPLFKSYVFVNIEEDQQSHIRLTDGVVNFVYSQGKPACIRAQEINLIKKFLNEYQVVQAAPIDLKEGTRVRINAGIFMDAEGFVIDQKNKQVSVRLETLGYELTARFEIANLDPVVIRSYSI